MGFYRVFTGPDGETHIEELDPQLHPELGTFRNVTEISIHQYHELRTMDFHPLQQRRILIHLSGEVEIGVSDGAKHIFRAGDLRLMEDTTGRGHTHRDLTPTAAAVVLLRD